MPTPARRAAFLTWLDKRTIPEMLSAPVVVIGVPVFIRWLRRRRRRTDGEGDDGMAGALACFDALVTALAARGIVRNASETVEQLARRVAEAELSAAGEASTLLKRYAAWRYGGLGDRSALEKDMTALAARLSG